MEIAVRIPHGKWTVVEMTGRVDAHSAEMAEKALLACLEKGEPYLAVGLAAVSFMSSAGLRSLLMALKAAQKRNGKVALLRPQATVLEVLEMCGFTGLFSVVQDLGELV